jgi:hypothetical protein
MVIAAQQVTQVTRKVSTLLLLFNGAPAHCWA